MTELEPLSEMPSSRLTDLINKLDRQTEESDPIVLNLESLIPKGRLGAQVLKTFLLKLTPNVHTLSLRYNDLSAESIEELLHWLSQNNTLLNLYLDPCFVDYKVRDKVEAAWRKNLYRWSVPKEKEENPGYTFYRYSTAEAPVVEE